MTRHARSAGPTALVMIVAAITAAAGCSERADVIGPSQVPSAWATYMDEALGFSIRYPQELHPEAVAPPGGAEPVPIDAPAPGVPVDPDTYRRMKDQARLQTVSFLDASSRAELIIEVFRKEPATPLGAWLQAVGVTTPTVEGSPVRSAGAGDGVRIGDDTWYFATAESVYGLVIHGPDATQILGTFRVLALR